MESLDILSRFKSLQIYIFNILSTWLLYRNQLYFVRRFIYQRVWLFVTQFANNTRFKKSISSFYNNEENPFTNILVHNTGINTKQVYQANFGQSQISYTVIQHNNTLLCGMEFMIYKIYCFKSVFLRSTKKKLPFVSFDFPIFQLMFFHK